MTTPDFIPRTFLRNFSLASRSLIHRLILLLAFGLLCGFARSDDWPMFRHDLSRSGATDETLKLPLIRAWTYDTRGEGIYSSAAAVGDSIYFGSQDKSSDPKAPPKPKGVGTLGSLYCLNAADGRLKWRFNQYQGEGIGGVKSSPAVLNDRVYFSAADGYFYCLSTLGLPLWRTKTGGLYDNSSPAVSDGRIFFSSGAPNKDFFCLRATDGELLWRVSSATAKRSPQFAYTSPAVSGDTAYFGANNAVFFALNTADGSERWHFDAEGGNPYLYAPTLYDGRLLCATSESDPHLYAVDAKTGKEAWRFTAAGSYFYNSSPAASNGVIYIGMGNPDQSLYAVNASTGKEKWHFDKGFCWIQPFTSSPAVAGNLVVVGAGPEKPGAKEGRLFVLDVATGKPLWQDKYPAPISASPTVAHQRVFIGDTSGVMYAYGDSSSPASP